MYQHVRASCAVAAVVGGAVYFTALWVAAADGPGGVTLPSEASRSIVGAISALTVIALGGWIIEQTIKANIESETRRVVAEELGRHTGELHRATNLIAASTRAATITEVRQLLADDVTEIIESGLKRAERRGMVREATSRAGHINGATVHALRPGEEV